MTANVVKLGQIATIDISNVDKKSKVGEAEVRLCNFVDVYHNWAITDNISQGFMVATANENQVVRFSVKKGMIAITKDSETRNDIGIPTYIADDFTDVVLGYHCALIKPDETILEGKYLNVVLHTEYAKRYFEANASGSGQRYTLTNEIIAGFPVPLPTIEEQRKIGNLFSTIDKKIENNNAICVDLEGMAKLLYDYWFVQFDFPDENGKPYKSSGGKMVWNEKLKREIPEGWEARRLEDLCSLRNGINYDKNEEGDADFKIANVRNITASTFLMDVNDFDVIHLKKEKAKQYFLKPEDIVIARSGTPGAIRLVQNPKNDTIFCGFIICCTPKVAGHRNYLAYTLKLFEGTSATKTGGSILQNVSQDTLNSLVICIPPDEFIEKFNIMITSILEGIQNTIDENRDLTSFRDFLLPMLMNGQVKVKGA